MPFHYFSAADTDSADYQVVHQTRAQLVAALRDKQAVMLRLFCGLMGLSGVCSIMLCTAPLLKPIHVDTPKCIHFLIQTSTLVSFPLPPSPLPSLSLR